MRQPKTIDEAKALTEGVELNGLAPEPFEGDTIMAFIDEDGRAMQVSLQLDRPVKVPIR